MLGRLAMIGLLCCPTLWCVKRATAEEKVAATKTAAKTPLILAHRGGAHEFEENTMAGFRACYERGIRGFETDVRMTRDGVLVVLHDDSLERTHNGKGPIEAQTADELRKVTTKKGQKFLFLEELLDYFADKPGVCIELEMKTSNQKLYPDERIAEYCARLYQQAQAKMPQESYYLFTSFDERPLRAIRALDEAAPISIIAGKPLSAEFIERAKGLKAQHIACQLNGTSRAMVREAQKQGYKINCWPGHTVQDYYLAVGLGVDVACTDIPTKIQQVQESLPTR
ncbi:putative glycerophosphoryl diester phosphodiesterase 1 [Anatilimnocola aggregata]|uniref:Putative glycerophosphoryl diester phosphodiesterase 1 n=1 Tax=Anatilimnocola aggregata TaxID=2528021 RepID=A0A517Y4V3_9BACT|nr:glycerophosphodiester phosphodiesterase [Anatilimnocola aggregata]QDU25281.1 putative glycerophosphoryl diester phosphodiesterase 1 [Anatilimnocola aggregata]